MFWQISLVVFLFVIDLNLFLLQMREGTYRIFLYPNPTQEKTLSDLLEGRRLMAKLTDFESFAQRTLIGTITETPGMVFIYHIAPGTLCIHPAIEKDNSVNLHGLVRVLSPELFDWHFEYCASIIPPTYELRRLYWSQQTIRRGWNVVSLTPPTVFK